MAAKTDIWMPLYIGDYLADTAHLSTEESGAYLHLLMHQWRTGSLPADLDSMRKITRIDKSAWSSAWRTLQAFFKVCPDGSYSQERLERERVSWSEKKAKAVEKARTAANAKHNPAPSMLQAPLQGVLESCPSPSPSPSPKGEKELSPDESQDRDIVRQVFEFYAEESKRGKEYMLTPLRMTKGLTRWRECKKACDGDEEQALKMMERAVLGLTRDKWNRGENPGNRKYLDWIDHLFGSAEMMSKRIENFHAQKGWR